MLQSLLVRLLIAGFVLAIGQSGLAEQITRSPKLPATTPWNLEELSKAPEMEWVDSMSTVRSLRYRGEPYRGAGTNVFAYYATPGTLAGDPTKDQKLPAVVLVHGGGGTAFREWAELWARRGYAALAMDLAGYRPIEGKNAHQRENRERLPDGGPDQGDDEKFGSVDNEPSEQWPYHAVAAVIRGHSLIRSFKEVDPERTAVTGISWGGYLTCIVAGLDNRFRAAVPVYGCGFLHDNSAWLDRFHRMNPEQRERWTSLWDPSRYLPAVSMPIFFVNGTNDFAYPLDSYMASYRVVPGSKSIRVTVNMPHSHPAGWEPAEIGLFVDQHLRDATPLPVIHSLKVDGHAAQAVYSSSSAIRNASLHVTTGKDSINKREWTSKPAVIDDQTITSAVPADATAWFFTITDARNAIVSSEVVIK